MSHQILLRPFLLGAEVVTGDLGNKDSIRKALTDREAIFVVTHFGDPSIYSRDTRSEIVQAKLLIDTAKEVGVKFFLSKGNYSDVPTLNGKAEAEEYL
ncbi:hypothetical protein FIBSPDRAFT_957400 [Athelia psychrophila]|uniref:NmrA-like domain-containing protein n=1 Tax=Athelia psychrophila TaxID=1759441 RepID=A0A166FW18_9AGAM|nr:hypothetical protein FIBSPDRAFT_957400 [Fibularhizoctonia sp. CBS 109695]